MTGTALTTTEMTAAEIETLGAELDHDMRTRIISLLGDASGDQLIEILGVLEIW